MRTIAVSLLTVAFVWSSISVAARGEESSKKEVSARWKNGCKGSRGVAMDDARGFLFVGCDEGKLTVLDLNTGAQLGSASSGSGADIIAYNSHLAHAYLPGAQSGTMAIIGISAKGAAAVLATAKTAEGAHCVAADDRDNAYVCDPNAGRFLIMKDTLAPYGS